MIDLRHCILLILLLGWSLISDAQNFGGNPSFIKWRQVNGQAARIIYPVGLDSQAGHISNVVEFLNSQPANSLGEHRRKWNIILQNQTTTANGYVRLAPVMSEFYMTPPQNNFIEGSLRWDDNLAIHESRHMQQFGNFNTGFTRAFSLLLGQQGQLLANGIAIPDYFFEGDAVWQETYVSTQGRGRLPEFFNGFKSLWLENRNYSWMKLRSGSFKDYTPDHYPLGYMLTTYGYEKFGKDFWQKVTTDAVRFKGLFFAFNKAVERYSGVSYNRFRSDALTYYKQVALRDAGSRQDSFHYITPVQKNNVIDYLFPTYISDDSIIAARRSYRQVDGFYLLANRKAAKIRVRNTVIDYYFSYRNGLIAYASYQSDPRWGNRDYSVLQLIDIKTGKQTQLTHRSKYFSPEINKAATEILAVEVTPNGANSLARLNIKNGSVVQRIPNAENYFFTQTKYIDSNHVVSAVRNPAGQMAIVRIDLNNGQTEKITPFSFNVVGYPCIDGDTVYFNASHDYADQIFAVSISTKKITRLLNNVNGIYYPAVNRNKEIAFSAFTSYGLRIAKTDLRQASWEPISVESFTKVYETYTPAAMAGVGAGALGNVGNQTPSVTAYKKTFRVFNFHSRRPVVADPEYGYSFYSDDVLSNFTSTLTYTYNRNELSHTFGLSGVYGGLFPFISLGAEGSFNRTIDTALGKSINFNSAKISAGINVPLSFTGGRTNKYFSIGGNYNLEQLYYRNIGKNVFNNNAFEYFNSYLFLSNVSRQAPQHVNPRWAQSISAGYRYALNFRDSRKFVGSSSIYFPGLFINHSLVLQGAFQKRDTLPDIFSNNFSYSRGYLGLSTRRMYKLGINYQLPLAYPDIGFGNIIFFQRIRATGFYDYTRAYARRNGILTNIINRSTGTEVYFDTKIWNALPVIFGVRYSRLLDEDLRNPGAKNRWEFILPIALIP